MYEGITDVPVHRPHDSEVIKRERMFYNMNKNMLYGKKQRFGSFFLRIFVPFILVAALLGGIVTYLLVSIYNTSVDNGVASAEERIRSNVNEAVTEYQDALAGAYVDGINYDFETADNKFTSDVEYTCEMLSAIAVDGGAAASLYYKDSDGTLTLVAGHDYRMFFVVTDDNNKKFRLSCTYEDYQKMMAEAPRYGSADGLPALSRIEEIYVKGTSFWISKYSYYDYGDDVKVIGTHEAPMDYGESDEKSVTVTEIPDGYVKLDTSKGYHFYNSSLIGSGAASRNMDYEGNIETLVADLGDSGVGSSSRVSRNCDQGKHNTDVVPIGNSYYLVMDYHTDLVKSSFGKAIIATWIGIALLSTLVSLAIAYVLYRSYKSVYDMEQYRRTTSNAMAHDLKSPLAVISLYAENLKAGTNPEKNQYYMDGILDEVRQMNTQVATILDMAKAEDVDTKLKKTEVDLTGIVDTVAQIYNEKISEKDVQINISGACTVSADEALMYQAVVNIMDNAVKYVTDGGHIAVELSDKEVSFVNSCEPLDKDTLTNVWKPFVKGDNSRHGHKGTGLGLSIVKTIMDRHGFDCEMKNVDDGVEVRLIFRK